MMHDPSVMPIVITMYSILILFSGSYVLFLEFAMRGHKFSDSDNKSHLPTIAKIIIAKATNTPKPVM